MKKFILYTLILLMSSTAAYSQFKLGVKGGFNINNINIKQNESDRKQVSYSSGLGFHFGLSSQLKLSLFYIQPELIFSTSKHEVTVNDVIDDGLSEIGDQRFNKLDIPIIAGLKFDNNFKVGLGPVFTKTLSSKSDVFDNDSDNKATVGYQFAAGWDWDHFSIEARYEGNLSKYGSGVRIGNEVYDFDQRTNQFIVTMGLYF